MGGIYWLASYPKSGNTWFRIVLANYIKNSNEPVDINQLNTGQIASNRLWIDDLSGFDTSDMTPEEIKDLRPHVYRWSAEKGEIGYHKIHDAYSRTRSGRPIIDDIATLGAVYIVRNPLSIAASLANHNNCSIDKAIEQMADDSYCLSKSLRRLSSQLQQHLGSWSHHVKSWIDDANIPIHMIRYEDMIDDPEVTLADALEFLGFQNEQNRLRRALSLSSFDQLQLQEQKAGFRERPAKTQVFFRSGKRNAWASELSDYQVNVILSKHHTMMLRLGYVVTR